MTTSCQPHPLQCWRQWCASHSCVPFQPGLWRQGAELAQVLPGPVSQTRELCHALDVAKVSLVSPCNRAAPQTVMLLLNATTMGVSRAGVQSLPHHPHRAQGHTKAGSTSRAGPHPCPGSFCRLGMSRGCQQQVQLIRAQRMISSKTESHICWPLHLLGTSPAAVTC